MEDTFIALGAVLAAWVVWRLAVHVVRAFVRDVRGRN